MGPINRRSECGPVLPSGTYALDDVLVEDDSHALITFDQSIGPDEPSLLKIPLVDFGTQPACDQECIYYIVVEVEYGSGDRTLRSEGVLYSNVLSAAAVEERSSEPAPSINDVAETPAVATSGPRPWGHSSHG